ncbi:MAG: lysophospholipid acyltransferase family protein [Acidobacteriaceae bacterium]
MVSAYTFQQRIALFLVPRLASLLIRLIGITLRFEDVCEPGVQPGDRMPGPGVFCFWHRHLLTAAWRFRNLGIGILISRSFDGELIARTVERLGFKAVRGSSSRGGAVGLLGMETAYREGRIVAFTADGPRGPVYVAKPGAAKLAQAVGSTVGAFCVLPQRAWELNSWDRFLIPKPFSRVVTCWSQHVVVPAGEDEFAAAQKSVQSALDRAQTAAEKRWAAR